VHDVILGRFSFTEQPFDAADEKAEVAALSTFWRIQERIIRDQSCRLATSDTLVANLSVLLASPRHSNARRSRGALDTRLGRAICFEACILISFRTFALQIESSDSQCGCRRRDMKRDSAGIAFEGRPYRRGTSRRRT